MVKWLFNLDTYKIIIMSPKRRLL